MTDIVSRFEPIDRQQIVLGTAGRGATYTRGPSRPQHLGNSRPIGLEPLCWPDQVVEGHAGRNVWEPRLLIAIWVYAYSRGISSAREIERQCAYEPALRWLTGLKVINHHTLSDFRVEHRGGAAKPVRADAGNPHTGEAGELGAGDGGRDQGAGRGEQEDVLRGRTRSEST